MIDICKCKRTIDNYHVGSNKQLYMMVTVGLKFTFSFVLTLFINCSPPYRDVVFFSDHLFLNTLLF